MRPLKKYSVVWFDEGNCEIAEVEIEAFTPLGANAPAYAGLSEEELGAVLKEAVSVVIKEL